MDKKYDTLVLIGRFQPFHSAHLTIIQRAKILCKQLIIITGSAHRPRTYKNPFTVEERHDMIRTSTLPIVDGSFYVKLESNIDTVYNDAAWAVRVQTIVSKHTKPGDRIGLIGHKKDNSSFYLDMFPQWAFEDIESIQPLNATDIRDLYFRNDVNMNFIKNVVPESTYTFLKEFRNTAEFLQIVKEREFIATYKKQYESLPYPPIFVTSDSVVICSGHVLMIKRRSEPGKGLWALPGGFVNAVEDKSVLDAAIRELKEETGIKVPVPVLKGSITANRVFDAVDRSARGRTITHCFLIQLADGELPKVKGSDDAEKARWVPIAEVRSDECFEDHYEILSWALGGGI